MVYQCLERLGGMVTAPADRERSNPMGNSREHDFFSCPPHNRRLLSFGIRGCSRSALPYHHFLNEKNPMFQGIEAVQR